MLEAGGCNAFIIPDTGRADHEAALFFIGCGAGEPTSALHSAQKNHAFSYVCPAPSPIFSVHGSFWAQNHLRCWRAQISASYRKIFLEYFRSGMSPNGCGVAPLIAPNKRAVATLKNHSFRYGGRLLAFQCCARPIRWKNDALRGDLRPGKAVSGAAVPGQKGAI